MTLRANITMAPIWNVVTVIPGEVDPEHVVVLGNHRDAWVAGAIDPTYATALPGVQSTFTVTSTIVLKNPSCSCHVGLEQLLYLRPGEHYQS